MFVVLVLAWTDAPLPLIVILMAATAIVATLFWPAQRALLPSLVVEAEELTSANVVSSTLESIGSIIGPALGGLALALFGVTPAFLVPIVAYSLSALAITRVRTPEHAAGEAVGDGVEDADAERADEHAGMLAGIAAIVRTGDLRVLVGLLSAQVLVAGALNVLTVVVALQLLGGGDGQVGLLLGAIGIGGLLGALPALALANRVRLTTTFGIGLAVWARRSRSSRSRRRSGSRSSCSRSSASATRWSMSPGSRCCSARHPTGCSAACSGCSRA